MEEDERAQDGIPVVLDQGADDAELDHLLAGADRPAHKLPAVQPADQQTAPKDNTPAANRANRGLTRRWLSTSPIGYVLGCRFASPNLHFCRTKIESTYK